MEDKKMKVLVTGLNDNLCAAGDWRRSLGLREGETVYAIMRNPRIFLGMGMQQ